MKTVLKLLGFMLFASTTLSLQAFIVENRSPHEITICTFEQIGLSNNLAQKLDIRLLPKEVTVTWIDTSWRHETFDVDTLCIITLQPGQLADITIPEDKSCHIMISFMEQDYTSRGSSQSIKNFEYHVSSDDTFIFEGVVKITRKF